jgi:hypothetical protein
MQAAIRDFGVVKFVGSFTFRAMVEHRRYGESSSVRKYRRPIPQRGIYKRLRLIFRNVSFAHMIDGGSMVERIPDMIPLGGAVCTNHN